MALHARWVAGMSSVTECTNTPVAVSQSDKVMFLPRVMMSSFCGGINSKCVIADSSERKCG